MTNKTHHFFQGKKTVVNGVKKDIKNLTIFGCRRCRCSVGRCFMFGGKEKKRKNFWTKHWRSKFNKQIFVMVFRLWWIKMTNSGIQRKKLEMNFFLHRIRLWKHKNKRFIHMKKKNLNQDITHTNRKRDFRTNWIESFFFGEDETNKQTKNWSVWILKLKFNPFSSVGYDDKNFFFIFRLKVWRNSNRIFCYLSIDDDHFDRCFLIYSNEKNENNDGWIMQISTTTTTKKRIIKLAVYEYKVLYLCIKKMSKKFTNHEIHSWTKKIVDDDDKNP